MFPIKQHLNMDTGNLVTQVMFPKYQGKFAHKFPQGGLIPRVHFKEQSFLSEKQCKVPSCLQ